MADQNPEALAAMVQWQRVALTCILIYFGFIVFQLLVPEEQRSVFVIALAIFLVVTAIAVFQLALRTHGRGLGTALALLGLVPLVGLVILVVINVRATRVLRENGFRVGLFGAYEPRQH